MSIDALVSSLQPLSFDGAAPYTPEAFAALAGEYLQEGLPARWRDLERQLRNTIALARGGARDVRPAAGCDLYWRNRVTAALNEKNPLKREEALARVWWDAAGELTPAASPLSRGALYTYAIRLEIVRQRAAISEEAGSAVLDRLTAATRIAF